MLCLSFVVMRCQPLRRALCKSEIDLPHGSDWQVMIHSSDMQLIWFNYALYLYFNLINTIFFCCVWFRGGCLVYIKRRRLSCKRLYTWRDLWLDWSF
ncbi:hypothetical protein AL543_21020 [Vibrio mimicus]|nr:hypothetical protein AL543_21020 [Vibrio mimicus]